MIIWNDTPDDPNRLPTLTEEVLKEVETRLGVKLPDDYLDALRTQNGGYIEQRDLPIIWNGQEDIALVDSISGVGLHNGLIESKALLTEWGVEDERLIAFAGDGHFFLAFDYREGTTPKIAYIDTDTEEIDVLFDSFSQFSEALMTVDFEPFTGLAEGEMLIDYARRQLYSADKLEKAQGANTWLNGVDMLGADELVAELLTWMKDETLQVTAINTIQHLILMRNLQDDVSLEAFFEALRQNDDSFSKQSYEETKYIVEHDIPFE
ncbi:SMI1/KNR4 family protein [Exiguobacterium alkaliphilum]|uniref:SMI1/KNR4 family protein n=1 Tax=Exiguobacterium alkaliphilum TaxID=1428684 RepID=UPI001BAC870F|nr:SMI1/KNR4 family protein [Exiguobacterium alkaliphilum]QUE86319.1 SMI1/KNR4 family protein [Exiguobacterium alkaliphilum]